MRRHAILGSIVAVVAFGGCGNEDEHVGAQSQPIEGSSCFPASPSTVRPTKVEVTADRVWDPFGILGPPVGDFKEGELICPGHQPTGNPLQPCPEGSRIWIRGSVLIGGRVTGDPLLIGRGAVTINANWDANGVGTHWGTFELPLNIGGTWAGTWEGTRTSGCSSFPAPCWTSHVRLVGCGRGGDIDGMHLALIEEHVSFQPVPYALLTHVEGQVFAP